MPLTGASGEPYWSPGPLLGFRWWRLTWRGLYGAVQWWDGPRLEARCLLGPGTPHDARVCRCGIYAFREAEALLAAGSRGGPVMVYGLVALSGKVVEHERGYRAQRAEVLAVAVPSAGTLALESDPEWIVRLFIPALGAAGVRGAEGVAPAGTGLQLGAVEYLADEARRFSRLWTSENRSG